MKTNTIWIWVTIVAIWVAVLVMSMGSPDLQFGDEPQVVAVGAIMDWFWGLVATVGVLRLTIFRRPSEIGWGQDIAWPWVFVAVAALWAAAAVVSLRLPTFEVGSFIIPAAVLIAPVAAAMITWYVCEFLIAGFAARQGGTVG
jgi:hypothetical protein